MPLSLSPSNEKHVLCEDKRVVRSSGNTGRCLPVPVTGQSRPRAPPPRPDLALLLFRPASLAPGEMVFVEIGVSAGSAGTG